MIAPLVKGPDRAERRRTIRRLSKPVRPVPANSPGRKVLRDMVRASRRPRDVHGVVYSRRVARLVFAAREQHNGRTTATR